MEYGIRKREAITLFPSVFYCDDFLVCQLQDIDFSLIFNIHNLVYDH